MLRSQMPFIDFHTLVAAAESRQWLTLHGIFVLSGLLAYVLTTHSLQKRRSPSAAISWVLTIALMPYVGLPLYLMFGTRKLTRFAGHASAIVAAPAFETDDAWARQLTAAMGLPPAVPYGDLQIHGTGTQALESLWKLIDSAQHELVLCTFLVGRDPIGHALIARIAEKARGGVAVRLLIDGVGRIMGGAPSLQILKAAGVKVALFSPHGEFVLRRLESGNPG